MELPIADTVAVETDESGGIRIAEVGVSVDGVLGVDDIMT